MKRLLPLFLVVALVVAMAVPCFAAISGTTYSMNDVVTYLPAKTYSVNGTVSSGNFSLNMNSIEFDTTTDGSRSVVFKESGSLFFRRTETRGWEFFNGSWFYCSAPTVTLTGGTDLNSVSSWFNSNGIVLSTITFDDVIAQMYDSYTCVFADDGKNYYALGFSHSDVKVELKSAGDYFVTNNGDDTLRVTKFVYTNGSWVQTGSQITIASGLGGTVTWKDWNTHEIKTDVHLFKDGEVFIKAPLPLHLEVLEVQKGAIPVLLNKVGGAMKILVPCGVGLVASLMVLSLFGKRFVTFLR